MANYENTAIHQKQDDHVKHTATAVRMRLQEYIPGVRFSIRTQRRAKYTQIIIAWGEDIRGEHEEVLHAIMGRELPSHVYGIQELPKQLNLAIERHAWDSPN